LPEENCNFVLTAPTETVMVFGKGENMTRDNLQADLHYRIDEITNMVNTYMKNDGDSEETSQRILVLNHICALDLAVNGIRQEDII
jgi:hypothetical protein